MLQITPQHRLLLPVDPVDLGKVFVGLKQFVSRNYSAIHLVVQYLRLLISHAPQSNCWCMTRVGFGSAKNDSPTPAH